jgi:NADH:ubiquinone oxidoreductase subunit 2 (subunit N)
MAGLSDEEKRWLRTLLVELVGLALLLGLLQFSGAGFYIPLINGTRGEVSGSFSNRNHFALFLAIGCVVAATWAFVDRRWVRWSGPMALSIGVLALLTILATGSRAGILLGGLASVLAAAMGAPGWLLWTLPCVFYGIVPFLDWAIGSDPVNAPESAVAGLDQDRYYLRIVYFMYFGAEREAVESRMAPAQWALLVASATVMVLGVANLFGIEAVAAEAADILVR